MDYLLSYGNPDKPLMHFAHGNGFPPKAYKALLDLLADHYLLICQHFRCLLSSTPPKNLYSWDIFLKDWEQFLDQSQLPSHLSVGHSMGGILSLLLCKKRPEFFTHLVLLDPLFLNAKERFLWSLLKSIGLSEHFYLPSRQAKKRKTSFESEKSMLEHYRGKEVFQDFSEEALISYVESISKEDKGRVSLNFSSQWEAKVYASYPSISFELLKSVKKPILILTGEKSKVFASFSSLFCPKAFSHVRWINMKGCGHLLPMERPQEVFVHIQDFLRDFS